MTNKVMKPTNREILQNNLNKNREKSQVSVADLHALESKESPVNSSQNQVASLSNQVILG